MIFHIWYKHLLDKESDISDWTEMYKLERRL